jgi:hypothetical protein
LSYIQLFILIQGYIRFELHIRENKSFEIEISEIVGGKVVIFVAALQGILKQNKILRE